MSSKYPNENLFSVLHFFPHRCSLAWYKVNLFDAEQGRSVLSFFFFLINLKLQPRLSRCFTKIKNTYFFVFSTSQKVCTNTHTHTFLRICSYQRCDKYSSLPFLSSSRWAEAPGKHQFLQDAANSGLNTLVSGFSFGKIKEYEHSLRSNYVRSTGPLEGRVSAEHDQSWFASYRKDDRTPSDCLVSASLYLSSLEEDLSLLLLLLFILHLVQLLKELRGHQSSARDCHPPANRWRWYSINSKKGRSIPGLQECTRKIHPWLSLWAHHNINF